MVVVVGVELLALMVCAMATLAVLLAVVVPLELLRVGALRGQDKRAQHEQQQREPAADDGPVED